MFWYIDLSKLIAAVPFSLCISCISTSMLHVRLFNQYRSACWKIVIGWSRTFSMKSYWVHAPRRIDPQKGVSIACGLWGKFEIVGTIWLVLSIESAVALRDWLSCATIHSYLYSCFRGGKDEFQIFFPTCQVRVVRFYVSLLRFLLLLFFFLVLLPRPPSSPSSSCCPVPSVSRQPPCPVSAGNRDHRRQCSLPDLNRDHLCSVFPARPRPRPK